MSVLNWETAAAQVTDLAHLLASLLPPREQQQFWIEVESVACGGQGDARNAILEMHTEEEKTATCPACKSWVRGICPVCTYCGDGQPTCARCNRPNGRTIFGGRMSCRCKGDAT